jgi:hypothetical protein
MALPASLAQVLELAGEQRPERYGDLADQHGLINRKLLERLRLEDSRTHKPTRPLGRAAGLTHSFMNQAVSQARTMADSGR